MTKNLHLTAEAAKQLQAATAALAAIGLTINKASCLVLASEIAAAAQDPEQWEEGAEAEEIIGSWSQDCDAEEMYRDDLYEAAYFLTQE